MNRTNETDNMADIHTNVFLNRNFRLGFFGALVSEMGAVLYSFAVSFYILEITGNNAFLQGLYLALCGAVMLLFTPVGGVMGDRFNKAVIMFVCDYLKGVIILLATACMFLSANSHGHLIILFIAGILGSAVSGVFTPAASALLPHIIPEDRLQQGNAYYSVKNALQNIFGVVLAGILYAALSIQALFVIVGICYILSGVSEMFIRYDHKAAAGKLTLAAALGDMKEGLIYLKSQKPIVVMMAAVLFINFFFSPVAGNFIPYFVKTDVASAESYLFDSLLTPELWYSVLSMLTGISTLVGSIILSSRPQAEKCGRKSALLLCVMSGVMIVVTVGYWLLVPSGRSLNAFLLILSVATFIIGLLLSYINIPIITMMMRIVEKDKLSKVSSISSIASQGLIPIASVLGGLVLQYLGSTPLLLLCTAGFTITTVLLLFSKEAAKI